MPHNPWLPRSTLGPQYCHYYTHPISSLLLLSSSLSHLEEKYVFPILGSLLPPLPFHPLSFHVLALLWLPYNYPQFICSSLLPLSLLRKIVMLVKCSFPRALHLPWGLRLGETSQLCWVVFFQTPGCWPHVAPPAAGLRLSWLRLLLSHRLPASSPPLLLIMFPSSLK